ncbi:MAG: hypothetical protein SFU85_03285 [Candidatus Methylacidiphilales bacterium]|nr:hypothetical protein [Candidatus Methylacidiphilales bacterium]
MNYPLRPVVLTSCLAGLLAVFTTITPVVAQDSDSAKKTEMEQIKRMENSLALNSLLDEAGQLVRAQDYGKARSRYASVIEQTTKNPSFADTNARARKELAAVAAIQARQEETKKSWDSARTFWQEAVTLDPANKAYKAGLEGIEDKNPSLAKRYPGNTAVSPELEEKVNNIQKLLFEGDSFHETGQYQRAIGRYKEVLAIDPTNKVARLRIEKTEKTKERAATLRYEAVREKRLAEVDEAYHTKPVNRRQVESAISTTGVNETRVANMFEKLEKIVIPELNFTDVDVVDAIKFLQEQSKALDPEKTGVNFVLKVNPTASSAPAEGAAADTATAPPPPQRTLTLNLRKVPLMEVLRFITNLTNLQFKVEEFAVYVFPNTETSDVLVVRSFSVPPNFFSVKPQNTGGTDVTGGATVQFVTADVKKELEGRGVKFPAGASAAYLARSAKLVVKNTLDQINLIEQLLSEQTDVATQIEIETKFVDFTEDQFKEFGFNYRLSFESDLSGITDITSANFLSNAGSNAYAGKDGVALDSNLRDGASLPSNSIEALLNPGASSQTNLLSVSAILFGQGFEAVMRAIEATTGADLMSAPKVTVVNGQKTKIRVVREFIYPTEYEAPEIQTQSVEIGGTSAQFVAVAPSNPSEFVNRDVGVIMEVKADASKDRRIDLELTPEVTEFLGFINYGQAAREAAVNTAANDQQGNVLAEGVALTPVFQMRKVETKLQVIDGQTVVMGGFIRNDTVAIEDKIPLLGDIPLVGRLFRSKTNRDVKRNLIIFTTARIMNPNGTPKFLTDSEADAMETSFKP